MNGLLYIFTHQARHFSTLALVQPSRGPPQDLHGVHSSSTSPDTDGITSHWIAVVHAMSAMYKAHFQSLIWLSRGDRTPGSRG